MILFECKLEGDIQAIFTNFQKINGGGGWSVDCLKVEKRVFEHMLQWNLCAYSTFFTVRENDDFSSPIILLNQFQILGNFKIILLTI